MSEQEFDLESVFRALTDRRRRVALRHLQSHRSMSLADLAELVAERESDASLAQLSPEHVRDVYFSLYHKHVPILVEADLAEYEQEADLVRITNRTETVLSKVHETVASLVEE